MIDDLDSKKPSRLDQALGDLNILRAGFRIAGRMVVRHDHGGRVVVERGLYDLPRGDGRHVDGAPVDE